MCDERFGKLSDLSISCLLCVGLLLNDRRETCYDTLEFCYKGHAGVLDSPPDCNG